ncbi:hypothetical protein SAMN04487972_1555 [Paracoccus halophilus]|uniref:Uncharacterized protein n=1 Tax=Paracoccus halophilus TaxID=376733 RepID=A0A1I0UF36_9RHOB|nr:hypothetical protein [Paracoccus halophilus]SFA62665.1 hypothetical protein SAMN04487972_1555 [Paracoccus halophilus]
MAVFTPTTPHGATEVLPLAALYASPVLALFEQLNDALAHYVAAERDLREVDCWDPAFRPWLTDSEEAHADLMQVLAELRDADAYHPDDALLLQMGEAAWAVPSAETGAECRRGVLQLQHGLRLCGLTRHGFGSRIPGLIGQADRHLHALILLDLQGWDAACEPAGARGLWI